MPKEERQHVKHLLATLALLCGTAHANGNHDLWFDAKDKYPEVRVNWIVSSDVVQTCNTMFVLTKSATKYNANIKACAVKTTAGPVTLCDIYTGKQTSLAIIGHEVRHCFEGAWHE